MVAREVQKRMAFIGSEKRDDCQNLEKDGCKISLEEEDCHISLEK